jgi:nicotinate-nucleotide pyrophosphorylase (carboxylating)
MISSSPAPLPPSAFDRLIDQALAEDLGRGDITTEALFPESLPAMARIISHENLVAAGLWLIPEIYKRLDPAAEVDYEVHEGQSIRAETVLIQIKGDGRHLLSGERVALNFLQRLCGIATQTAHFVKAIAGYKALILDTRKTTPGWRLLEKYAVRMGGGSNHRTRLDEGILIKDNHLSLIGNLKEAIKRAKAADPSPHHMIEIEVKTLDQVEAVLKSLDPDGKDTVMLDNMKTADMQKAVDLIHGRARVEVSGGVTLSNIREIAACGVDFISVGALTHSARAVDISMEIVAVG